MEAVASIVGLMVGALGVVRLWQLVTHLGRG